MIILMMHDTLDDTLPLNKDMWADLKAAFGINHVYKINGKQTKGFVQFGPEHTIHDKKVCVLTPVEADEAGITPVNLSDYVHEPECAYIFGPDNTQRGWHKDFDEPNTDYVTIITPSNTELYSFTAAAMVMWHRLTATK